MFLVQKLSWALQEKQEPIHFHGKNEISLIWEDLVYRKKFESEFRKMKNSGKSIFVIKNSDFFNLNHSLTLEA